jgi:hypothetical protein
VRRANARRLYQAGSQGKEVVLLLALPCPAAWCRSSRQEKQASAEFSSRGTAA